MRGFEKVSIEEFLKHGLKSDYENIKLPTRGTKNSAGYDFYLPFSVSIKPKEKVIIPSGIKAYMESDEALLLVVRSSLGIKHGIRLLNQVGVIDSDYYNNESNEGHILIGLENASDNPLTLNTEDRIVQGIFIKYLIASNEDKPKERRLGGIGSTL